MSLPGKSHAQGGGSGRGMSFIYRRAILKAIENLNDFQHSNVDLVRRHTMDLIEEDGHAWNDVLFFKTLKSISNQGDVEKSNHSFAELSPTYKKTRTNALIQRILNSDLPMPIEVVADTRTDLHFPKITDAKSTIVHRQEHEKYKFIPRKHPLSKATESVNNMDTR